MINEREAFFLLISGEVHFAMFSQHGLLKEKDREDDLYEVTSSGLSEEVRKSFRQDSLITDMYTDSKLRFFEKTQVEIILHIERIVSINSPGVEIIFEYESG